MRKAAQFLLVAAALAAAAPTPGETPAEILGKTERAADWQLKHLDTAYLPRVRGDPKSPRGWVTGTFLIGLTALADRSTDSRYRDAVYAQGRREKWLLEARPFHADDYMIGQSWIWAFERSKDPVAIAAVEERLDAIIAAAPGGSLDYGSDPPPDAESDCQRRWCWADALFMGPPTFAALSHATGAPRYLAYADAEFWATVDFLLDPEENLLARDSRFFARRGPRGEKIFWSRGNGWAYAAIVRMLQLMPADHPSRPRYEALFRHLSSRLITVQKTDGYWPVSLLGPPEGTPPETSGTGFFTYGLAYGVKTGLLEGPAYREAAIRGWTALERAVGPDGKLGWVQQIGSGPQEVSADDTQPYGVGAFLLAGVAVYDLAVTGRRSATTR